MHLEDTARDADPDTNFCLKSRENSWPPRRIAHAVHIICIVRTSTKKKSVTGTLAHKPALCFPLHIARISYAYSFMKKQFWQEAQEAFLRRDLQKVAEILLVEYYDKVYKKESFKSVIYYQNTTQVIEEIKAFAKEFYKIKE